MLKRDYEGQNCSIARALEVVGERWTLLIIRDALLGLRRFDEFQRNLGIARKVLADRLRWLVDERILERVPYQERPERYEYHLTRKGRDLHVALVGLRQLNLQAGAVQGLPPETPLQHNPAATILHNEARAREGRAGVDAPDF